MTIFFFFFLNNQLSGATQNLEFKIKCWKRIGGTFNCKDCKLSNTKTNSFHFTYPDVGEFYSLSKLKYQVFKAHERRWSRLWELIRGLKSTHWHLALCLISEMKDAPTVECIRVAEFKSGVTSLAEAVNDRIFRRACCRPFLRARMPLRVLWLHPEQASQCSNGLYRQNPGCAYLWLPTAWPQHNGKH